MSFVYESLAEDEIRLLTVETCNGATVSAELRTYPRSTAPSYDAVSYAWGDDVSITSTMVNGLSLTIRTTLFEALPYIHDSRPEPRTRLLWIDAICLNQDDEHEKAVQVLRMNEIFQMASRTLIWLGQAENNSDLAMTSIESFTQKLLTVKNADSLTQTQRLASHGLPPETNPVWGAIQALGMRSWFFRLWTLQEIVLSEQPVLLCGHKSIPWAALVAFYETGAQARLTTLIQEPNHEAANKTSSVVVRHVEFMRELKTDSESWNSPDLSVLLMLSEDREYTLPVDRVWALLGLLDQRDRQRILDTKLVDYSEAAVQTYHETFLSIMKFHIKHARAIAMKLIENRRNGCNPLLPSWCPDWHIEKGDFEKGNFSLSRWTGSLAGLPGGTLRHIEPFMQVNEDASLELCGLVVDAVDRVTTSAYQRMHRLESCTWLEECLKIINEYDFVEHDGYPARFSVDSVSTTYANGILIPEWWQKPMRLEQVLEQVLFPPNIFARSPPDMLTCDGRKFFRTKAGRFGVGPANLEENDILCAMYGARALWALRSCTSPGKGCGQETTDSRQRETEEQAFELLGNAYTPSLLRGEAWVGTSCEAMRRFKLR